MKKRIISIILLLIAFSCNDKEEKPVTPIPFETQIEIAKNSAKSAAFIIKKSFEVRRQTGTTPSEQAMSQQFKLWYEDKYDYSMNIPEKVESTNDYTLSERFSFFLNQIRQIPFNQSGLSLSPDNNLRVFTQDSIEYTLEEYKFDVLSNLSIIEKAILIESDLIDEEKIALISSIAITSELVPVLIDELSLLFEEEVNTGRTLGLIKWVAQKAKQIINGIATVVYAAVDVGLYLAQTLGWPLLVTPLGIKGLIGAAIAGGLIGAALGLDCVIDQNPVCYTCVFAVNEVNDPCYQY